MAHHDISPLDKWEDLNALIENRGNVLDDCRNRPGHRFNDNRRVLRDKEQKVYYTKFQTEKFFYEISGASRYAELTKLAEKKPEVIKENIFLEEALDEAALEYYCHGWSKALGYGTYEHVELAQKQDYVLKMDMLKEDSKSKDFKYSTLKVKTENILSVPEIKGVRLDAIKASAKIDPVKKAAILKEGYLQSMTLGLICKDYGRDQRHIIVADIEEGQPTHMVPIDFESAPYAGVSSAMDEDDMHRVARTINESHGYNPYDKAWKDTVGQRLEIARNTILESKLYCPNKEDLLKRIDNAQTFTAYLKLHGIRYPLD